MFALFAGTFIPWVRGGVEVGRVGLVGTARSPG